MRTKILLILMMVSVWLGCGKEIEVVKEENVEVVEKGNYTEGEKWDGKWIMNNRISKDFYIELLSSITKIINAKAS